MLALLLALALHAPAAPVELAPLTVPGLTAQDYRDMPSGSTSGQYCVAWATDGYACNGDAGNA